MAASNSYVLAKRWPNSKFRLTPKGEVGFLPGEIKADPNTNVKSIRVPCTMKINATTNPAAALNATKIKAIFDGLFVRFSTGPNTGRDGDRDKIFDYDPVTTILRALKQEIQRTFDGYSDTTDGLGMTLAAGANYVNFTIELPTGHVEQIQPVQGLFGMGPGQLATADFKLKMGADPLHDADANLAIEYIDFEVGPGDEEACAGDQWCDPPIVVLKDGTSTQDTISLDDGCWLAVNDRNATLSANGFGAVTVDVGEGQDQYNFADDPAVPNDLYKRWVSTKGVGTIEDLSGEVTPLYNWAATRFKNVRTGPIRIKQRKPNGGNLVTFKLEGYGFVPRSTDKVKEAVKLMATKLPKGSELKAIAVKALEPSIEMDPRHAWIAGFRTFTEGQTEFGSYCGWKCAPGGEPEIDIPTSRLHRAAVAYAEAQRNPIKAEADAETEGVIRTLADEIPGAAPHGRGYEGGKTEVYVAVRDRLLNYIRIWNERQAAK